MRITAPASRAGPATTASRKPRDFAWPIAISFPARAPSRSLTDSGAAAPVIIMQAGFVSLASRLNMQRLSGAEITGSASGASRRPARNVRRSRRRLTGISRHPGTIGRASPGSREWRIIAFQVRLPRRQTRAQQHRQRKRHPGADCAVGSGTQFTPYAPRTLRIPAAVAARYFREYVPKLRDVHLEFLPWRRVFLSKLAHSIPPRTPTGRGSYDSKVCRHSRSTRRRLNSSRFANNEGPKWIGRSTSAGGAVPGMGTPVRMGRM